MKNGLEKLGNLIWRVSRDVNVYKFASGIVYELPDKKYVVQQSNTYTIVDEFPLCSSMVKMEKLQDDKGKEILLPLR